MIRVAFPTFAFSFINLPLDPLCVAFRSNHIATLFLYSVYIVSSKLDSKKVLPLLEKIYKFTARGFTYVYKWIFIH